MTHRRGTSRTGPGRLRKARGTLVHLHSVLETVRPEACHRESRNRESLGTVEEHKAAHLIAGEDLRTAEGEATDHAREDCDSDENVTKESLDRYWICFHGDSFPPQLSSSSACQFATRAMIISDIHRQQECPGGQRRLGCLRWRVESLSSAKSRGRHKPSIDDDRPGTSAPLTRRPHTARSSSVRPIADVIPIGIDLSSASRTPINPGRRPARTRPRNAGPNNAGCCQRRRGSPSESKRRRISSAFSCSGRAWAALPWALRLAARLS